MKSLVILSILLITNFAIASGTDTKPKDCFVENTLCDDVVAQAQTFRVAQKESFIAFTNYVVTSGTDTRQILANGGNTDAVTDVTVMSGTDTIFIKSLKFFGQTDRSLFFQVNGADTVYEINDARLNEKPNFYNYLNKSYQSMEWVPVK